MYDAVAYLDWLRGRPATALYDLGASEPRRDHADPAIVPPSLDGLADPPAGATLPALIATYYGVSPDRVLVTAGVDHAAALATAVATAGAVGGEADSGSTDPRILVERPSHELRRAVPASLGAAVDRFDRDPDPDGGTPFALDPGGVRDAATSSTALVTVSNCHEASGQLADETVLEATAATARATGARLLVVEAAPPVGGGSDTGASDRERAAVTAAGIDGAVVAGSLSQFPGLGGLRVGWLIADPPFVDTARRYADAVPSVAGPSATLARRALYHAASLARDADERYRENAALAAELIERRNDVSGVVNEGSPVALLDHEHLDGDALAAAAWDAGVLVIPGRFFERPSSARLSLAGPPQDVAAGLRTLERALDGVGVGT